MSNTLSRANNNSFEKLLLDRNRTIVMGVLNITPDSFYDGGQFNSIDKALIHCEEMVAAGADIIDIGGESSRPDADPVSLDQEVNRVIPIVEKIVSKFSIPISIDTTKTKVAEEALKAGAVIINDISGLNDEPNIADMIAHYNAGVILMHKRGTSKTMQKDTKYCDIIQEITDSLKDSIHRAESAGIAANKIMIDPGIGFGKDLEGNLTILKSIGKLKKLGKPVLIGASRKSFIGMISSEKVENRLPGSIAAAVSAVLNGTDAVRVHDVAETRQAVDVAIQLRDIK